MDNKRPKPTRALSTESFLKRLLRNRRIGRVRAWARSRQGRIFLPALALLGGMGCGILGVVLYALTLAGTGRTLVTPLPPKSSDIVVQIGPAYISTLLNNDVRSSSLPGNISNVRVSLARGAQITIDGDDAFDVFGITVTRHFTVVIEPYVGNCQVKAHVIRADLSGIPVTGFVSTFEGQINQQLAVNPTSLPKGFTYCTSGVRTAPEGVFVMYSAKPTH